MHSEIKLDNPYEYLGLHELSLTKVIRISAPDKDKIHLKVKDEKILVDKQNDYGIFEYHVPVDFTDKDYQICYEDGRFVYDPYSFDPLLTKEEIDSFEKGSYIELYNIFGAHITQVDDVKGCRFSLWAPNAKSVSLIGDFNNWDGRFFLLRKLYGSGVWEIFMPDIFDHERYKFEIQTEDGHRKIKTDPFGFSFEKRPHSSSSVCNVNGFYWEDSAWMEKRKQGKDNFPLNIYEVHLGSWKENQNDFFNYKDLSHMLCEYCKKMGYTHIELLPIMEHPLDESWGYQVIGYFAPTSRYGSFDDFQYFVNYAHQQGIGVIIDWVPGHFPTDDFALNKFDGTSLYEHEDPLMGFHPQWSTNIFDYRKKNVCNFLISSALFFLEKTHVDGIRVDAVSSIIYLDYAREKGKWIPNKHGGNLNLEGIDFLKSLNKIIHEKFPDVLMIAEESTHYPTTNGEDNLGFDLKWDLGWMNDTLQYFTTKEEYKKFKHDKLTFNYMYAFSENFILPLSHDEVVHGKKSLLGKMGKSKEDSFENLKLLLSFMMFHTGKKLTFMGTEIAQEEEWNCKGQINWDLLNDPLHKDFHEFVSSLNHFYLQNNVLWYCDFEEKGFSWIDCCDKENNVISYVRKGKEKTLFCIHNFSSNLYENYEINLANVKVFEEVFNSNQDGKKEKFEITKNRVIINLQSLSTYVFFVEFLGD